jgi:tryptophan synthase beta chain
MASYDKYLAGDLNNYTVTDKEIEENLKKIGDLV